MRTITLTMEATPETLRRLADALAGEIVGITSQDGEKLVLAEPTKAETAVTDPTVPEKMEAPASEERKVTKSDVRALGSELSKLKRNDVIQDALSKFGATKLSEVAEKDYPALAAIFREALS